MKAEGKNIRPEKQAMVQELKDQVSGSLYVLLADYGGMDMPKTDALRGQLRGQESEFHVVKNRLLKVAGSELGLDELEAMLSGATAMVTGSGDVVEVGKVLRKFSTENEQPVLKGGMLEGAVLSAEDVVALSKLPPLQQLQGKLVGTLAAPMTQLVGVMKQKLLSLVYVLQAAQQKKEES